MAEQKPDSQGAGTTAAASTTTAETAATAVAAVSSKAAAPEIKSEEIKFIEIVVPLNVRGADYPPGRRVSVEKLNLDKEEILWLIKIGTAVPCNGE